jgi:ubiquinone/menaquinone biosynthesis C-methylase UbiE
MSDAIERMVPETAPAGTYWEHVRRYRFACSWVRDQRVVDIACGTGYGTRAMKVAGARSAVGFDISQEAVDHARQCYGVDARVGDALAIPLPDASVDVVVSFETIEHVTDPGRFLDECRRIIAPGGRIIISTPNTQVYDPTGGSNPYHLSEMDEQHFVELVGKRFTDVRLYSQTTMKAPLFSSLYFCARQSLPRRVARRMVRDIRKILTPGKGDPGAMPAGEDPVRAILGKPTSCERWFEPTVVRERPPGDASEVMYVLAVATRP